MDRAMTNLLARVFGALALSSYFLHAGMHLVVEMPDGVSAFAWVVVSVFLLGSVGASWALARLNAKRAAVWTAYVLVGLVPVGAFIYHRAPLGGSDGFGVVLLLNLIFGGLTMTFTGMLLFVGRSKGGKADA